MHIVQCRRVVSSVLAPGAVAALSGTSEDVPGTLSDSYVSDSPLSRHVICFALLQDVFSQELLGFLANMCKNNKCCVVAGSVYGVELSNP